MVFCLLKILHSLGDLTKLVPVVVSTTFAIHGVIKLIYMAIRRQAFVKTLKLWDDAGTHPLFEKQDEKTFEVTKYRTRRWLFVSMGFYLFYTIFWTISPFFDKDYEEIMVDNVTMTVDKPRLIVGAWYPLDLTSSPGYQIAFLYQVRTSHFIFKYK